MPRLMFLLLVGCLVGVNLFSGRQLAGQQPQLPPTPNLTGPDLTGPNLAGPNLAGPTQTAPNASGSDGQAGAPDAATASLLAPETDSNTDLRDNAEALQESLKRLPEEIQPEAKKAWEQFEANDAKLAEAMGRLRETQIAYRNDLDRTPAAIIRFRERRDDVWKIMQEQFTTALDLIRYLPSSEAASFLVTMVQHRFKTDIYDDETFEAAARLLDLGQNYRFLYLAGARSSAVVGKFESTKQIYDALHREDLEDADLSIKFQLEVLQTQFKEEEAAIAATDPDQLPQVRIETTMGSFLMELFPDSAPSAVAHFLKLVENGFYEGMDWSVVTQNVLALSGDASGDGRGNASEFLIDEHDRENARHALRGSVIMAKIPLGKGEFVPNSASSQFAVAFLPIAAASRNQTIIGRVIEGMDVVSRLRRVDPTKEKKKGEVQLPPDSIITTEVVRAAVGLPEPNYVDMQKQIEKAAAAGLLQPKQPAAK